MGSDSSMDVSSDLGMSMGDEGVQPGLMQCDRVFDICHSGFHSILEQCAEFSTVALAGLRWLVIQGSVRSCSMRNAAIQCAVSEIEEALQRRLGQNLRAKVHAEGHECPAARACIKAYTAVEGVLLVCAHPYRHTTVHMTVETSARLYEQAAGPLLVSPSRGPAAQPAKHSVRAGHMAHGSRHNDRIQHLAL